MRLGVLLLLVAATSGCATRYCERNEQVYETAIERAPLQSPEGLQVPPPDPNFAIPEATGEDVKYATPGMDSKGRASSTCLDTPPTLLVTPQSVEQVPNDRFEAKSPDDVATDDAVAAEAPEPGPAQLEE